MHPNLFSIGPLTLHSYGLMIALGLALAIYLAWKQAPREGIDQNQLLDMSFWLVVAGLIGGRLLYGVVTWKEFRSNPLDILRIWDGGLIFYGAFAFCAAALWLFCRRHRIPSLRMLDLAVPYVALAHGFGRIGCFLSGCCYGRPSASCLAVEFPSLGDHTARLPTQLFESVFNFALFFTLVFLRRYRKFQGQLFWIYIGVYAAGRFVIEIFRGDEIRGWVWVPWLHTSQLIALVAMALAVGMLLFGPRPAVKEESKAPAKA